MFLGGKNFKICDFGQKKPSDFGEDLFVFCRSPALGRKICDFGQKKPSHFGENLCPHDLNFAPPPISRSWRRPWFRHLQNNLAPLISNLFIKTNDISVRHTRSSNPSNSLNLYISKYHSARLQSAFGIREWKFGMTFPQILKLKPIIFLNAIIKKYLSNQY